MHTAALEILRCTDCCSRFEAKGQISGSDEIDEGLLTCAGCGGQMPIVAGIPRFVPAESYADNFGLQWNRFAQLQVDRISGNTASRDRFFLETGLRPEELRGRRVLEAGCGGGRFSDVVLAAGAELYAVDLSNAVDKNRALNGTNPKLHLAQASILDLPFVPAAFDLVFCFGVLQHTPDPAATFRALVPFVRPGGRLAVDVYAAHPKQTLHLKYLMRPVTRRMSDERLLALIEHAAPPLVSLAIAMRRIPKVGRALTRLLPLKIHDGIFEGVTRERSVELAVLETFDALAPAYDRPRSRRSVQRWFDAAGFSPAEAHTIVNGLNYGWGVKPLAG
jgi:SAM-dependent methyltransferase